ncbi:hypothetical protein CHS0354_005507 [Potamilus streckersoni]|uniref:Sulfotransferase domain-containing protein n=1 Tax=Potamilus streckersoni TaxID=2493646 RepID=A0AAE0SUY5_9BIVA|nr:hypothetical protein CHS0354_005507 [Potamilus streckersoni]
MDMVILVFCMPFTSQSRRMCFRNTCIISSMIIFICVFNLWIPSMLPYSEFIVRRWRAQYRQNLMAQPKFDFLSNYKNPCFIKIDATRSLNMNVSDGDWKEIPQDSNNIKRYNTGRGLNQDTKLPREPKPGSEIDQNKYQGINRTKYSGPRLYCLPYFLIAGFPKCGTTDLWHRIIQHPDIVVHPKEKEPMFFDNRRFYNDTPTIRPPVSRIEKDGTWLLETYLEFFTEPTTYIEKHFDARNGEPYHDKITGEGSSNTMPINDEWFQLPENANLREPKYTNADHVHHLIPQIKIIVMIRDPVERLLSGHLYFSEKYKYDTNKELFHNVVVDAVNKFKDCLKYNTERGCAYDKSITTIKNRIRVGLYAVHIADWFRVFSRQQFLFLKTEDYIKDVRATLVKVFDFLQLEFPPLQSQSSMLSKEKINKRTKTFDMLPATRKLLQDFYRPYNDRLWKLLGDERFHYTYSEIDSLK